MYKHVFIFVYTYVYKLLVVALVVINPPANAGDFKRCGFNRWFEKIPWRSAQQPTAVFLARESHGQRSLVGYSP